MATDKTILVELTEEQFNAVQYCLNIVFLDAMRDKPEERRHSFRRPEFQKIVDTLPQTIDKFKDAEGKTYG